MKTDARRILVGFDFSPQSERAVEIAVSLAGEDKGRVYVLSVYEERLGRDSEGHLSLDTGAENASQPIAQPRARLDEIRHRAEETVRPLRARCERLVVDVVEGKPYQQILNAAQRNSADLILVGATGAGRLERWILGSTAERVARRSPLPVMVTKRDQPWPPRHILCPVDFSPASTRAAAWAAFLSERLNASLQILYVVPLSDIARIETFGQTSPIEMKKHITTLRVSAERRMSTFVSAKPLRRVGCRSEILLGAPFERILERASEWKADLIVMGTVGRDGVAGMLIGNTAERVLRGGPCSVLTVRPAVSVAQHS